MNGFDVFQLAALGAFLALFAGRTITLRVREGINPIVLGTGNSGTRRAAELLVPLGFAFWIAEVANHALGGFLMNGTPVLLAIAVVVAVGVHFQILQEERFLAGRYGNAYERYRERTGRYMTLPGGIRV